MLHYCINALISIEAIIFITAIYLLSHCRYAIQIFFYFFLNIFSGFFAFVERTVREREETGREYGNDMQQRVEPGSAWSACSGLLRPLGFMWYRP